jgi:uncharacterized phage protein gp47/JayE
MAELTVKSAAEIRDDILRTISNGLKRRGVDNPAVGVGSDYYLRATAVANEIAVCEANTVVQGERLMPDTTEDEDLDRWLAAVGLAKRPAGPSEGRIVFETTAATLVAAGSELVDPLGNKFEVTVGGTYDNDDKIPIESVEVGTGTNLDAGTVLRWVSTPAYAASTAELDAGGTTGGVDAEDNDTARARLLARLANPPRGGNWQHVAEVAEAADVEIQKAFVYPAANGPATCHVALAAYASASTSRTRVITDNARGAADAAIVGEMPEHAEFVVTKTQDFPASVTFILTLPEALTAIPAGGGGGWIDGVPWPSITGLTNSYCVVTVVTSTTSITLQSAVAPSVGETIQYVNTSTWKIYTAKVLTTSTTVAPALPTPGQFAITLDAPLVGIAVNKVVFPGMVQTQRYLDAVLDHFAKLGPGEKTDVAGVLPRAYRRPYPRVSWPSALDNKFLKALTDSGDEVIDAEWGYQNGGVTEPTLPGSITSAPKVFVPGGIGFYHE